MIFGWPDRITTLVMGALITIYTVSGGIKAVTWTDVLQMIIIFLRPDGGAVHGYRTCCRTAFRFADAVYLAGAAGKLNAVDMKFDWNNRYNLWSGLIGGTFLVLGYFGCDQSQVQRYLTGKSISQSKLSLLFNAMAKIPMQFFILFVGAMVFVFFLFEQPPLLFQSVAMHELESPGLQAQYEPIGASSARRSNSASRPRSRWPKPRRSHEAGRHAALIGQYRAAQQEINEARAQGAGLYERARGEKGFNDTNYIFLSFVTHYLPAGVVGLLIAVIFAAAMSSSSGEVNSLATVTVIDVYKRHIRPQATDRHYLWVSRLATAFWGVVRGLFRAIRQEARIPDRGRESARLAVLRVASGGVRAGILVPACERHGRIHRHAGGRGRHLRGIRLHGHFVSLVQRDWLPGGDCHRRGDFLVVAAGSRRAVCIGLIAERRPALLCIRAPRASEPRRPSPPCGPLPLRQNIVRRF